MDTTFTLPQAARRTLEDLARAENASESDIIARALAAYAQLRVDAVADARWERLFADPGSEAVLAELVREGEAAIAAGQVYDGDPASR